jgi:acetoin:2,6-dichlorophenolindophenol oxidoreductase subunit alpha
LVDCFYKMILIRRFEERLIGLHDEGQFSGHFHVYIGQEATGVPALLCLEANDVLFTTHRNHGHLLARGADPGRMLAEILGRKDGYNKGKGGTFHLSAREVGFVHTSAIVAGAIPIATGAAYAAKARRSGQIAVCLTGDGALEEGAAPEALNIASLWKLPILYLCENNGKYGAGRAVGAAQSPNMAVYPLTDLPKAYKIPSVQIDGMDVEAVGTTVTEAVSKIRSGEGPQFIEAHTVRWPGHESNWPLVPVPTSVDLAWNVSTVPEKVREWYRSSDPLLIFSRELVAKGSATKEELVDLQRRADATIDRAVQFALTNPYPDPKEALTEVFA